MAEFKLGRIRFVWKDQWAASTVYYVDDVIRVGGKTYICKVGHTAAADFYTDLTYSPTRWNQMTDGQDWKGDWTTSTTYKLNDVVKYGGTVYICNDPHTSAATAALGLEANQNDWDIFSEGIDWKSDWSVSTRYKVNDLVKYGGYTYVCNTAHTSAATSTLGLEADQAKWDDFNQGIEYRGAWSGSFIVYRLNDVVKQGASLWICTQTHTSTASFIADSATYWSQFVEGIEFEDTWNSGTTYQPGDVVRYGGNQYIAKTNHFNAVPSSSTTNWDLFQEGIKFQSDWTNTASYEIGEVVRYGGYSYLAIADSASTVYTVTSVNGTNERFSTNSTTGMVANMSVRFAGVSFGNVSIGARYYIRQVISSTEFTISTTPGGAVFNAVNGTGTMTATVSAEPPNATYWSRLNSGINWQGDWVDDVEYRLGDAVRFGANAYICVLAHRSEGDDGSTIGVQGGGQANSRPDQDVTGTYWNLLSVGTETAVLIERGDLVYYGGAGPTRLPIGREGQILRSDGTDPEWATLGETDQLYFVASHGTDLPAPIHGKTWDKPFKTIRYACEQVEKGPRNPNAQYLLELNRVFIQREVSAWIRYQIDNNASPFSNITVTEITTNNTLNTATAHGLVAGRKLRAKTTANGIVAETDYFVIATGLTATAFQVSLTKGGTAISSFTDGTGLNIDLVFDYDEYKCERDVGFVVDRLQWDIGHGGNLKIRAAAQSLLGILSEGPFSKPEEDAPYLTLADETEQGIAAYNYMLEVVEAVLANQAPAVVYQNVTDDSTSIAEQYINADLTTEAGVVEDVTELVAVITNALANPTQIGSLPTIPARTVPQTLIRVATGRYRETLPIIVPAYTCVQGDELRSTNAGPAGSLVDYSDSYYTINTLEHIQGFIGDVVTGTAVTPSAGNTTAQYTAWPVADTEEDTAVTGLVAVMREQSDFRLSTMHNAKLTDPVGYNVGYLAGHGDARKLIKENKRFLQEEIVTYINNTYSELEVVGSISGNILTVSSVVKGVVTKNSVIRGQGIAVGTTIDQQFSGTTGGVGTYEVSISQTATSTTIKADTHYSRTKTRRDAGYIIDAVIYDLTYGGNAQSVTAGLAYFDGDNADSTISKAQIPASIKSATLGTIAFLKTRMQQVATGANFTPLQTVIPRYTDTAGSAGASTLIGNNVDDIIEIIDTGPGAVGTTVTLTDPATTNGVSSTTALISAYSTLNAAAATIQANTITYVNTTFPGLVYDTAKCSRDVGIILKAVGYDFMLGNTAAITDFTNYQSLKAAHSYLRPNAAEVYTLGQKTATRAALEYVRTQAVANVGGDATAIARIDVLMALIDTVIYGGSNEGYVCSTDIRNRDYAILQLERNREFITAEVSAYIDAEFSDTATATTVTTNVITISDTSWLRRGVEIKFTGTTFGNIVAGTSYFVHSIVNGTTFRISATRTGTIFELINGSGSMSVELVYNEALCLRDVGTYIDALKWDLRYDSNYKSRYVARYYANAVTGSQEEDMYYLRDATGLRDQTLADLNGDLNPPNEYGTSRPTAGAYASLDPGWGPDDFRTWIITRSPYVQGLTTFGNGAIGQKIDGALHNGGNDSIVSNDFTQVISDGIGAWVANNGRAELVSVFTYYAHIGYLSTEGGRIRGTNGNCSYGDFGATAEGFDNTETPNTGVVDNVFQFVATVGSVSTNSQQFLGLEFDNAGIDYTEAEFILTGGGINAVAEVDEFRDDAVFQVRLLQLAADGADGEFGGQGYITNANTAQGGTSTSITLAATDSESSTAYIGMKVVITGGAGVGQFAIIDTYNSGTKLATVVKESTGAAGFDHFVAGTTIVSPDASSTYIVEPRLTFSAPTYASALGTGLPAAGTYSTVEYAPAVQTYLAAASTGGAGTGATFNVVKKGTKYFIFLAAGGTDYERSDVLTIAGTDLDGASTANDITITVTSINSITGAVTAFDHTGVAQGGNYVALLSGSSTAETSIGGAWTSRTLSASRNWQSLASGQDLTPVDAANLVAGTAYKIVSLGDTVFSAVGAAINLVGVTFIATGPTSGSGTAVTTNSVTVAIATGSNTTTRSVNGGITWTAGGNLPSSTTWQSVAYGQGYWIAIATGGTATAYSTDGGQTWTAGGALPASTTWTDIAYGAGKFVAVASGGTQAASTADFGATWTSRTLPTSTGWASVAFGNNRFVTVSSNATTAAYSLNGIDWAASPTSGGFTAITYGQGTFLAVGSTTTAASSPDGIVWTSRTINSSDSVAVAFGNVNRAGRFVTISDTGSNNASIITAGTTARGRASVANGKIFAVRLLEPGSGYVTAPTMTITDPNNTFEAPFTVRTGDGALANPSFINRGTQYETASAEILRGDGFADNFQPGSFVACRRLENRPVPGANVVFSNLPDRTFKLVNVITFRGTNDGAYTGFLQVSPNLTISEAPAHLEDVTIRLRYSQVRLTGHDFLDIGTGSFTESNYPGTPIQDPIPANETVENNGGRVFFTATDQDGNFRVGDLFAIEQSTGIATLNADAFNISGLQELNLGNVTLGGGSATITEFSTDPFFTADSDNIVPTQRAIKAFIASQIGGGGASLNVNSVTAGSIFISSNVITTVTGIPIKMEATFEFRGGVTGVPLAFNYFLQ
jgi:hypothetical protein